MDEIESGILTAKNFSGQCRIVTVLDGTLTVVKKEKSHRAGQGQAVSE
ncbi:MAG: hypothetical protein ACE5GZ_03765 [Gammaproteobacteria bacterium]